MTMAPVPTSPTPRSGSMKGEQRNSPFLSRVPGCTTLPSATSAQGRGPWAMGTSGHIHPWILFSSQGSGPQHHHQTLLGHSKTQDTGRTPWHPEEAFSCSLTQIHLIPLLPQEKGVFFSPALPVPVGAGVPLFPWTFGLLPWANHSVPTSSSHSHPSSSDNHSLGHPVPFP